MSDRLRPTGIAVAAVCAILLGVAVWLAAGWATKDRAYLSSVPQPPPVQYTVVIPVAPGASVCIDGATILPDSDLAQFRIGTRAKPPVPVTATASGPGGYRSVARIPATWKDNDLLTADIDPPARGLHG